MDESDQQRRRLDLAGTGDRRAVRTRDRLIEALGDVLASGDAPTVSAVCSTAGVGRSTFYTHFEDVDDIVVHIVDRIFEDAGRRDASRRNDPGLGRRTVVAIGVSELLQEMARRRAFFVYASSASASERLRERLLREVAQSVRASIHAERPDADDNFVRAAGDFVAGGLLGLLLGWIAQPDGVDDVTLTATILELLPSWLTSSDSSTQDAPRSSPPTFLP